MLAEELGFTDDGLLKIGGYLSNGISGSKLGIITPTYPVSEVYFILFVVTLYRSRL